MKRNLYKGRSGEENPRPSFQLFGGFPLHPLPLEGNGKDGCGFAASGSEYPRRVAPPRTPMRTWKYRITTRSARCESIILFKIGSS